MRLTAIVREHWLFAGVLAIGVLARTAVTVAYTPALFFPDSWGYVSYAYSGSFVGLPSLRPIGYPVLIRLLTLPGHDLTRLVALQHLAGLAIGVAIYVTLIRLRLPRWAAAAAAALVLLDGYAITLEQYVMSDTFFSLSLLIAVLAAAWPWLRGSATWGFSHARTTGATAGVGPVRAALAGLALMAAALQRVEAVFVIPVFLIYFAARAIGWRAFTIWLVVLALPLGAYAALIDHKYHVFGLTATSGWTLYGRVGGFADCAGAGIAAAARPLCETAAQRHSHPDAPDWYIWGPSPARRAFHPDSETIAQSARTNAILGAFARRIIINQPLALAQATLADFLSYFTPGARPYRDGVSATSLPPDAGAEAPGPRVQRRILPGLPPRVGAPAATTREYRAVMHVPRPVLALLAIAAILAVIAGVPSRPEVLLLAGSGLALLLGTAATGGFALRYLLPAVPLLAIGGSIAADQLSQRILRRGL